VPAVVAKQRLGVSIKRTHKRTSFVDKLSITRLFLGRPFLPVFGPFFVPFGLPGFRLAGSGALIGLSSGFVATGDVGSNWSG